MVLSRLLSRYSLRTSVLLLVLAVLVPLEAAVVTASYRQLHAARHAALAEALAAAHAVSARVDDYFSRTDDLLQLIAALAAPNLGDIAANDALLRQFHASLPPYVGSISVLSPDGRLLNSSTVRPEQRPGLDLSGREHLRAALATGGFAVGPPFMSETLDAWVVVAARPVRGTSGDIRAVVTIAMLLARFQDILAPEELPPGTLIMLRNPAGTVVASSIEPQSWVGRDLGAAPGFQRAAGEREFAGELAAHDGVRRLSAYTTTRTVPWIVNVGLPSAVVLAPARTAVRQQLWLLGAALAIALAGVGWLTRGILGPLGQLMATLGRIRDGDASARATPGGPREIAAIGREVNAAVEARLHGQAQLRESERRFSDLLDNVELASVMLDRDGRISYCNDHLCRATGWSREELLGRDWFGRCLPPEAGDVRERFQRLLDGSVPARHYENEILTKSGEHRLFQWNNTVLRSPDGSVLGTASLGVDITESRRAEAFVAGTSEVYELLGRGAPLAETLGAIARHVERALPGGLCTVLLLDADGVHVRHGAAPSLPATFAGAFDGEAIGPAAGSCGTAMHRNEQVIVTDIAADPLWADYRPHALAHGLRACWATPIRSLGGAVLGSFAVYFQAPRAPSATDLESVDRWTAVTGIAIERQRTAEALRESEQRLRLFIRNAPAALAMFDRDMRYLAFSRRWVSDYALEGQDLIGRSHYEVFPEIGEDWKAVHRRALAGEVVRADEDHFLRADGGEQWLRWEIRPWHSAAGVIGGILLFTEDITERKRIEARIRALNIELEERVRSRTAQLEAANRELEAFSYSASHDLRAPLRAIQGFAQIIAQRHRDALGDEARRYFDNIVVASERMTRLIEDLLQYARLGRSGVRLQPQALGPVVADSLRLLGDRIAETGARVRVADDLPVVTADASLLRQVFVNLLDNALTYRRAGEPLQVEVGWRREDGHCDVCVRDNGIGIPPAHTERVFQMFERLHGAEDYPGTGIGLAMVRKAAELMGGSAWVEPSDGPGASLHVRLALGRPPDEST